MSDKNSIPNKSHFTFDEVALITGVKKYVLRFWETEFEQIDPIVSSAGQKLFEHKDIEAIFQIKKLLFDQKLSIEKAKAILSQGDSVAFSFDEEFAEEEAVKEEPVVVSQASPAMDRPSQKNLSEASPSSMVNSSSQQQACDNLRKMIELADSIKKRHNWG